MNLQQKIGIFGPCLLWGVTTLAIAEDIRDYYAEPGLNLFANTIGQDAHEEISPFGGTLQLQYTDLRVPGNGGLDIIVQRSYTSLQLALERPHHTGLGWTMTFGRIVVPSSGVTQVCAPSVNPSTSDNPSIEYPDGSREMLFDGKEFSGFMISKRNWRVQCAVLGPRFFVTAPDGTVYTMDVAEGAFDETSWYTSRIEDTNGNWIHIAYGTFTNNEKYIHQITASDGRVVDYFYQVINGKNLLHKIVANEQTWEYQFEQVTGNRIGITNHHHLVRVIRPDGLTWTHQYHGEYDNVNQVGSYCLQQVTYPYGGEVTYGYQPVVFGQELANGGFRTVAVHSKTTGGRSIAPGMWTFQFDPATVINGNALDRTIVTLPNGRREYAHYGYWYAKTNVDATWLMGQVVETRVYDTANNLVEQSFVDYTPREISDEIYTHGRDLQDRNSKVPMVSRQAINRNESGYETLFSDFDVFGFAAIVQESNNIAGELARVTQRTYQHNTSNWILGLVTAETIDDLPGSIDRTYDAKGNLLTESRYGVLTTFTYTTEGDVRSITDANNNSTTFSNYFRGQAQLEERPENVTITRTVNPSGTIASIRDGRGFLRSFSYDTFNHLTGIVFPIHAPVVISWTATGRELTRGTYKETETFNGFGQTTSMGREDTASASEILVSTDYDALGQKIFESYPNSSKGTVFTYDVLGRIIKITHPDDSMKTFQFLSANYVRETDETGKSNEYLYQAYGAPDNDPLLIQITTPENGTTITRNLLGLPMAIAQGDLTTQTGFTRTFSYDAHYFLATETHPETGDTVYGRDAVGNIISKRVGSSPVTTYRYDALNRATLIDYPESTADVTLVYDENNNLLSSRNAIGTREYHYDDNNNLNRETILINTQAYDIRYTINSLDHVERMEYPSSTVLDYSPDAFGRPSKASPFVTSVEYHPSGSLKQVIFANGVTTQYTLTPRLWINRIQTSTASTSVVDLTYTYDVVGNTRIVQDGINSANDKVMEYDGLHRLIEATGPWGTAAYTYSAWGNILTKTLNGNVDSFIYNNSRLNEVEQPYNNTRRKFSYDVYGNIASDGLTNALHVPQKEETFLYDHAGNLVSIGERQFPAGGLSTRDFGYDGDNMRVIRDHRGKRLHFLYARNQNLVTEHHVTDDYRVEHFYLGHQRIASMKENRAPHADAGPDQNVFSGQSIAIDGNHSSDPDDSTLGYLWRQIAGTTVTLTSGSFSSPSFTFDAPMTAQVETLTFELTVSDSGSKTATDTVSIVVTPNTPGNVDAGPDQTVTSESRVTLDGSGSSDGDGIASYHWTQLSGALATLLNADQPVAAFTAPLLEANDALTFELSITDMLGATVSDTVTIRIVSPLNDGDHDGLPDAWETTHFGDPGRYGGQDDPDGDGVLNKIEWKQSTDPNNADRVTATPYLGIVKGDGDNVLRWHAIPHASFYDLYWATTPEMTVETGSKIASVSSPFVHAGLTNGNAYHYIVVAGNAISQSEFSNEVSGMPGTRAWSMPIMRQPIPPTQGVVVAEATNGNRDRILAYGTGRSELYVRVFTIADGWSSDHLLSPSQPRGVSQLQAAVDENGNAMVTWADCRGPFSPRDRNPRPPPCNLYSSYYDVVDRQWSEPQLVEDLPDGRWIVDPRGNRPDMWFPYNVTANLSLDFDADGVAYAIWTQAECTDEEVALGLIRSCMGSGLYSALYVPGTGWLAEERHVASRNLSSPLWTINRIGNGLLTWHDKESPTHPTTIYARSRTKAGAWGAIQSVETHFNIDDVSLGQDAEDTASLLVSQRLNRNGTFEAEIVCRDYHFSTDQWSTPTLIGPLNSGPVDDLQLLMNPAGDRMALWLQSQQQGQAGVFAYQTTGTDWTPPNMYFGFSRETMGRRIHANIDHGGTIAIAYYHYLEEIGHEIAAQHFSGTWSDPIRLLGSTNLPAVEVMRSDGFGNVEVEFSTNSGQWISEYVVPLSQVTPPEISSRENPTSRGDVLGVTSIGDIPCPTNQVCASEPFASDQRILNFPEELTEIERGNQILCRMTTGLVPLAEGVKTPGYRKYDPEQIKYFSPQEVVSTKCHGVKRYVFEDPNLQ